MTLGMVIKLLKIDIAQTVLKSYWFKLFISNKAHNFKKPKKKGASSQKLLYKIK